MTTNKKGKATSIVRDTIYIPPKLQDEATDEMPTDYRVVFIPGNPGLVSYCEDFLKRLSLKLNEGNESGKNVYHIFGFSLAGFEVNNTSSISRRNGLEAQLDFLESKLADSMSENPAQLFHASTVYHDIEPNRPESLTHVGKENRTLSRPQLILIGHSLGTWLCLGLMSRSSSIARQHLAGTLLINPVVFDIAKSERGMRWGWLLRQPWLASAVPPLLGIFSFILGKKLWRHILSFLIGLFINGRWNPQLCDNEPETTAAWLSSGGLKETLVLVREELRVFKSDDVWDEHIWGTAAGPQGGDISDKKTMKSKLLFYFGHNDPWIANKTRDDLIARRGRPLEQENPSDKDWISDEWKPQMVVDKDSPPHAFCIQKDHSEYMATQAVKFIQFNLKEASP